MELIHWPIRFFLEPLPGHCQSFFATDFSFFLVFDVSSSESYSIVCYLLRLWLVECFSIRKYWPGNVALVESVDSTPRFRFPASLFFGNDAQMGLISYKSREVGAGAGYLPPYVDSFEGQIHVCFHPSQKITHCRTKVHPAVQHGLSLDGRQSPCC